MRKIKKSNPDATCFMQYDKLYVNNKIYVFNDLQARVSKNIPYFGKIEIFMSSSNSLLLLYNIRSSLNLRIVEKYVKISEFAFKDFQ